MRACVSAAGRTALRPQHITTTRSTGRLLVSAPPAGSWRRDQARTKTNLAKKELIKEIQVKSGVDAKTVELVLNATLKTVMAAVAAGDKVALPGFGTFDSKTRAARTGRNPATGASLEIPEKVVPSFTFGKTFKDTVLKEGKPTEP
eukprot:jgi/Tetstr1/439780/TSEL_028193.t1